MFFKLLMATSLSEASSQILRCLHGLKKVGSKEVILVHAMNICDVGGLYHQLRRLVYPKLEEQKQLLEEMGFSVEVEIPLGFPYYEINRIASEKDASLIVVCFTAESLLETVFSGDVACEVINRAEKPVLVLKARMLEETAGRRCEVICEDLFDHVFYPTDFSDNAERAFAYVEKIVESGCSKVTLFHVQDKAQIDKYLKDRLEEFNQIDQGRLERLKTRLIQKGTRQVSIEIPYGSPTGEILRTTRENQFSLIVMGSQGRGFISEVFLGSVSRHVLRNASVPVLLAPAFR